MTSPTKFRGAQRASKAPATSIKAGTACALAPPVTCNGDPLVVGEAATVPFAVAVTSVTAVLVVLISTTAELVVVGVRVGVGVGVEVEVTDTETEAGVEEGGEDGVEAAVSETREPVRLYAAAQAARSIPYI